MYRVCHLFVSSLTNVGLAFLIRINASPYYFSKLCGIPKPITKSINLSLLTGFNKIQKKKKKKNQNIITITPEIGETIFVLESHSLFLVCF